jgi:integration host factor subunit beta
MTTGSMTKAELVEEVSRVSDLTKKHSEVIVDTVFKSIIDALHRGEKIELRGFGSFRLRRREPRKGRNPKTGDKVDVPPKFLRRPARAELNNRAADPVARGRRSRDLTWLASRRSRGPSLESLAAGLHHRGQPVHGLRVLPGARH